MNVPSTWLMMTNRFPRISPNNCFQKRPMCRCPHVTGWTLDCVQSYAREARACIISTSTILLRVHDDELSDVMLPVPPDPIDADQAEPEAPPAASDQSISPARLLPQLFSDHERVRSPSPQISSSDKESSLPRTSATLLTNPSLTKFLSNYPIWPTAPPIPLKSTSNECDVQPEVPDTPSAWPGAGTAPSFKRGRGDHPRRRRNG